MVEENRLIISILEGDSQAYAILVNRYQHPIYNLLLRMTGSREEAADLSQDAFLKAYKNLEKFKLNKRFFPWLYAIAVNLARDRWRRKKNAAKHSDQLAYVLAEGPTDTDATENRLTEQLDALRIGDCLHRLPHDYREALILRFHEGLSMQEIGEALGVSTSGAKMRIRRGLEKLRHVFQGHQPTIGEIPENRTEDTFK